MEIEHPQARSGDVPTAAAARIAVAIEALRLFGDELLDRQQAETLLSMWRHRGTLTTRQRTEVLRAFPVSAP